MSEKLQPLKGMKDILPEEHRIFTKIVNIARNAAIRFGYEELSTPLLEMVNLFDRTLGDTSDVVSKEMYDFHDKGDRHIALRPEFTAGVMRAVISSKLTNSLPVRLFSAGPVFRYDRPQAGRQRQFHQVNFEHIGSAGYYSDAEIIELAVRFLEEIEVMHTVTLEVNSLGCAESRAKYTEALVSYFSKYKSDLSSDSKIRLEKNPLRILDSKDEKDRVIISSAPTIDSFYTKETQEHFVNTLKLLDTLGIGYVINKRLVRGLDYYCHTAFEFTTEALGAQGTVLAGGRYDGLCKMLGGPETPAIGFAAGIERLISLSNMESNKPKSATILPISNDDLQQTSRIASIIRSAGISVIVDTNGKVPKRIQRADTNGSEYVIFIGENERDRDMYKVKNLKFGEEKEMSLDVLMKTLKDNLL